MIFNEYHHWFSSLAGSQIRLQEDGHSLWDFKPSYLTTVNVGVETSAATPLKEKLQSQHLLGILKINMNLLFIWASEGFSLSGKTNENSANLTSQECRS